MQHLPMSVMFAVTTSYALILAGTLILPNSRASATDQALDVVVQTVAADTVTSDQYGFKVVTNGARLVVGARFGDGAVTNSGTAYVFYRSGSAWIQEAELAPADGLNSSYFGSALGIDGDRIVVGAPNDNDLGTGSGSAYVYVRSGGAWALEQKLLASNGVLGDNFGVSVSISGNRIVVGAYRAGVIGPPIIDNTGAAYVFVRGATTWTEEAIIRNPNGLANDQFGQAVAISGNRILIGAPYEDAATIANVGAAYIYVRSGSAWNQEAKVLPVSGALGDVFGHQIALDGDTAVVGVYSDDVGSYINMGSAYVFARSGVTWPQQGFLTPSDGASNDEFSSSVALSGDRILIGSRRADTSAGTNAGSAYTFTRRGSTWTQESKIVAPDGAVSDGFGQGVALADGRAVVGADQANSFAGAAYVFNFNNCFNLDAGGGTSYSSMQAAAAAAVGSDDIQVRSHALAASPSVFFDAPVHLIGMDNLKTATTGMIVCADNMAIEVAGGSLTVQNMLTTQNPATVYLDAALATTATGTILLPNTDLFCTGATTNAGKILVTGDSALVSNLTNSGSVLVYRGTLWLVGSVVNTGVMAGQIDSTPGLTGGDPPQPGDGMSISGDFTLGQESTLHFADPVWMLSIGGDFDCAIDDSQRLLMSQASLRLTGESGLPQFVEVMSQNLGEQSGGFASANFGLGRLEVATGASVTLLDTHDNSGGVETLYVGALHVEKGATLATGRRTIFAHTTQIAGTVIGDVVIVPEQLSGDINQDGIVDGADLTILLGSWGQTTGPADINHDSIVDAMDLATVLSDWGTGAH